MSTADLIEEWRQVYFTYAGYTGATNEEEAEAAWISLSQALISTWNNIDQSQYGDQFAVYLRGHMGYYIKLNEYYERVGHQQIVTKGTGGRWLP